MSVVIVDNASRDGLAAQIKNDFSDCTVIENRENVGFGRANNQALPLCNAPFVLLLNPDCVIDVEAISALVRCADAHQVAAIDLALHAIAGRFHESLERQIEVRFGHELGSVPMHAAPF